MGEVVKIKDGREMESWSTIYNDLVGRRAMISMYDESTNSYYIEMLSKDCSLKHLWVNELWLESGFEKENKDDEFKGCHTCKYVDYEGTEEPCVGCCHNYYDYYKKVPNDNGVREMQWILTDEAMPEDGTECLITTPSHDVRVYNYWHGWNRTEGDDGRYRISEKGVIAWMYLPEAYKG